MTEPTYFKVLNEDGTACHGGSGRWPLPNGGPGYPLTVEGKLIPCRNGLHLCREQDLVLWLGPAIYVAQYRGGRIDEDDKIVVRKARLLQRLDTWNDKTARLFACDCTERTLYIANDPRCNKAVAVARRFAHGRATRKELAAARDAARDAAGAAAGAAAWDAARAAEREWQTARLLQYLHGEVAPLERARTPTPVMGQ